MIGSFLHLFIYLLDKMLSDEDRISNNAKHSGRGYRRAGGQDWGKAKFYRHLFSPHSGTSPDSTPCPSASHPLWASARLSGITTSLCHGCSAYSSSLIPNLFIVVTDAPHGPAPCREEIISFLWHSEGARLTICSKE